MARYFYFRDLPECTLFGTEFCRHAKSYNRKLVTAVRAEVSEFMVSHAELLDDKGRQRLVRHGFLPEREVMTGIDKVAVQVPRVRDRGANADGLSVSTITRQGDMVGRV
jgi:hypothetical protein